MNLLGPLILLIQAGAGLTLAGHCALAAVALLRGRGPEAARIILADGVILALGLATGATLLTLLSLGDWDALGRFLAILALRTALKRAFAAERAALVPSASTSGWNRAAP
ncbi:hypothetical protein [Roseicella aquatilis]|uniref:Uncharacterized protein n=1 Tax=Roseicella aquatilis TaxID=2527868 RepID=A0A4R4D864_9PROT|nr:hypothetical protein [Roseicella aquatilis]TCZ56258.1 hypothetical protein EXY23_19955 [Roseicella aquatilis]